MYKSDATYDVLDPNTNEVFGRIKSGVYSDLQFRGGRELEDGRIQDNQLIDTAGKVIGHIEGDTLVQEHSGVAFPLRLHDESE